MKKGITIISLMITIVIILILAGAGTYSALSLIEHAKHTAFINEMNQVDEAVSLIIMEGQLEFKTTEEILEMIGERIDEKDLAKMSDGLKYEIMHARAGFPNDKKQTASPVYYDLNEFQKQESLESLYSIKGGVSGKEEAYIYDEQSASAYKVEPTIIYGVEMHGSDYGNLLISTPGLIAKTKKDNGVPTPEVEVKVVNGATEKIKNINVTAIEEREGIAEITLVAGEEIIKTVKYNGELQVETSFEVKQNRTYTIKVTGVYGVTTSKSVRIMDLPETIIFNPDGTGEAWVKSQEVKIMIANTTEAETNEIKYQWTESYEEPAIETFTNTCKSGDTITATGLSGKYYLWAYFETTTGEVKITSSEVFYFDNTAPTASLTYSASSATAFTLTATASDAHVGGTLKYEFYADNVLKHTVQTKDTKVNHAVSGMSTGNHSCKVIVTDSLGNTITTTVTARTKLYAWEKWSVNSSSSYQKTSSSSSRTYYQYTDIYLWEENCVSFYSNGYYKVGKKAYTYPYSACDFVNGVITPYCKNGWYFCTSDISNKWYSSVFFARVNPNNTRQMNAKKSGTCYTFYGTNYSSTLKTTYSKGSTKHGTVTSTSSSTYPNGGHQSGYWYVYLGVQ